MLQVLDVMFPGVGRVGRDVGRDDAGVGRDVLWEGAHPADAAVPLPRTLPRLPCAPGPVRERE